MSDFTASNGVKILADDDGRLRIVASGERFGYESPGQHFTAPFGSADALREFFRDEEDRRLGRWRWPENPRFLVYARESYVLVVDESQDNKDPDGFSTYSRGGYGWPGLRGKAARAYFDAHPEPKPWHDAKPWETWLLTIDGEQRAVTLDEDRDFRRPGDRSSWMHITSETITAGRKLWPEDAS